MSDCIAAASIIDRVIETINGAGPRSDDRVAVIAGPMDRRLRRHPDDPRVRDQRHAASRPSRGDLQCVARAAAGRGNRDRRAARRPLHQRVATLGVKAWTRTGLGIRRAVRPAGPLVNAILDEMAAARSCSVATAATLLEALRAVRNSAPCRRSNPPRRRSNRPSLDVPREAQSAMEEDDIERRTVAAVIGFSGKLVDVCHLCHLCHLCYLCQSFRRDCRTLLDRTCRGRGGCRHRWDNGSGSTIAAHRVRRAVESRTSRYVAAQLQGGAYAPGQFT